MSGAGLKREAAQPLPAGIARERDSTGGSTHSFAGAAGPLPPAVLAAVRDALAEARGTGGSPLEWPFTSQDFRAAAERLAANLACLLAIPAGYELLFVQGGATAQFAAVPLNLLGAGGRADYLCTGYWSAKAAAEAERFGGLRRIAPASAAGPLRIPSPAEWEPDSGAAYCHIVTNETAEGVQHTRIPETGSVPLVADMSSDFLTRPFDVRRFGLVYASSQKNLGIPGFAVVIARSDLLGAPLPSTPSVLNYRLLADQRSFLNTPSTVSIWIASLTTGWILAQGGLPEMERASLLKSSRLYSVIDGSGFYRGAIHKQERSRVNLCFSLPSPSLEADFLREAECEGFTGLQGHRAVGGIRVSLYNGMPESAAAALAGFMAEFARRFG